ncbi:MAG TPA: hypothetical protein PLG15_05355 [Candidatus Gastranaerophilaceae bacterium]|nr:hypothetical protein [Candidatus Gastranaerophilaceae bacterium]HPT41792.1 hypothetical protein [Candidatus Gastranaerophilaceae bacterium]
MDVKKKILIVDDSRGWIEYHKQTIQKLFGAQFALEEANCASGGYDMVYNNLNIPYALIISDLQMELDFEPKYAGEWLIEQVKNLKEYQSVPIIIISATYDIRNIASQLGVNCLPKSIAARDLMSYKLAIEECLR